MAAQLNHGSKQRRLVTFLPCFPAATQAFPVISAFTSNSLDAFAYTKSVPHASIDEHGNTLIDE